MARITTKQPFILEVDKETIRGTVYEPTKKQQKMFNKMEKAGDKPEDIYKKAIEIRVESDKKDFILELGKNFGYEYVFKTILYDAIEKLKKKESA